MTDDGRRGDLNIAALPAIMRLGACKSARVPTPIGALSYPICGGGVTLGRLFTVVRIALVWPSSKRYTSN